MTKSALYIASAMALPLAAMTAAAPAAAQEAAVAAEAAADTILVTAQKREQAIVDIPQAVSVVSGEVLEQQGASTLGDYLKLVPGLQLDQSRQGQGRLIVRGVNADGVASTVGVYMDETPFGSSSGLVNAAVLAGDFDPFDLERIEVLRGPQGTFYGASSLSGVLKFVTNAPSTEAIEVRARAGAETTRGGEMSYLANGVINLPLGETLALRATGSYRNTGGYIDSTGVGGSDLAEDINDSESYSGRVSLQFSPGEVFDLRLTALLQDISANANSFVESDPDTFEILNGGLTQAQFVPGFSDLAYRVYNGTATFDLGGAELVSSTSYSTQKQDLLTDYTFALSPLIQSILEGGNDPDDDVPDVDGSNEFFQEQDTDSERFTQELRVSGTADNVDWLLGLYYTHEDGLIFQNFRAVAPGTDEDVDFPIPWGIASIDSRYEELAGFANVNIHLSEVFEIGFGGRLSANDQTAVQVTSGALAGTSNFTGESDEKVFTWSVAPRYEVSDDVSLYARVATGFRPGGPNILAPGAPAEFASYDSDSVTSFEAGIKGDTGTVSFDLAAFLIDWDDIQLLATQDGFNFNANGGGATSEGVEFMVAVTPVPGVDLSVNGAYTDARLTEDTLIGGLDGDALPFTPKFAASVNAGYTWALSDGVEASLGASLRHVSDQSASFDAAYRAANGRQRQVPDYQVIDLSAGIDLGQFALDAWVRNLGDSRGRTSTTGVDVFGGFPLFPNGAFGTGIIRPRTFGVALSAEL